MGLAKYTLEIMGNEKSFNPKFQVLADKLIAAALDIYTNAWDANNINVSNSAERWNKRKGLQESAILACNRMLGLLPLAKTVYHLTGKRIKFWGGSIIETRNLLTGWKESDTKRYGHLV